MRFQNGHALIYLYRPQKLAELGKALA